MQPCWTSLNFWLVVRIQISFRCLNNSHAITKNVFKIVAWCCGNQYYSNMMHTSVIKWLNIGSAVFTEIGINTPLKRWKISVDLLRISFYPKKIIAGYFMVIDAIFSSTLVKTCAPLRPQKSINWRVQQLFKLLIFQMNFKLYFTSSEIEIDILQSSVSHDPSEIIIICRFGAQ